MVSCTTKQHSEEACVAGVVIGDAWVDVIGVVKGGDVETIVEVGVPGKNGAGVVIGREE